MSIGLIVFLTILFIVAMVFTFYAFKQEEIKMKKYKEEGDSEESELKRSLEYESTSVKKYIPIQIWMYVIATILSLGLILYYFLQQ